MSHEQINSAAYQEAGHMTAAVLQAMPIRSKGLYIDLYGHGVANYFDRPETDLGMTALDIRERKLTIIALFAAHPAQQRFFAGCEKVGWFKDLTRITALSQQICPSDEIAQAAVRRDLLGRATKLVDLHWHIIQKLAETLLATPCIPIPSEEITVGWGTGPEVRHMGGNDIVDFFSGYKIPAKVVDDSTSSYDSSRDVPYYDSLA
jgi:hypothetical protein